MNFVSDMFKKIRIFVYSVYFNFRILPFRQAVQMPVRCYVWPTIRNNDGVVKFECDKIRKYMVQLGGQRTPILPQRSFVWSNRGVIVFKGKCRIGHHSLVQVREEGYLEFGDQVGLNTGCRIVCQQKIIFKPKVKASWDCQFYDTNFHPLIDMISNKPVRMCSPIVIGENVWIGHNVIIAKGVKLADGVIVSSGSVVRNIFKTPNCLIAGNPAVKIGDNYKADFPEF